MVGHAKYIDAITAERDRLAAENAELKGYRSRWDASENAIKEALRRQDRAYAERDRINAELAAVNDTLDRLREVGIDPSYHGNPADWANEDKLDSLIQFQAILYPPETTSIRDTAAAHGFDAMPDDLAQRSVDGETNYVRLNPENET